MRQKYRGETLTSRKSFDRAIEISPDYLDTHVLKAQYYAAKIKNEELFKELPNKVIAADATKIPELVVENKRSTHR